MIQTAIDYAKELHKAGMTHEELSSVKDIFDVVPQVKEELNSFYVIIMMLIYLKKYIKL